MAPAEPFDEPLSENDIVGGELAPPESRPFQVLVNFDGTDGLRYICGGVLVHPKWVLTAAHW